MQAALSVPGTAGGVTITPVSSGIGLDINTPYNNLGLNINSGANSVAMNITKTGYSTALTISNTSSTATYNLELAGIDITGNYQHNGTAGIGKGIKSNVTNNTATSNVLYSGFFTATANSSGATSVGIYISSSSTSGTAYGLIVNAGRSGFGTTTPNASAEIEILSTTRGFLPPRMTTTQKNAISSPAQGLMVFDTTLAKLCVYNGTTWETITSI